MYPKMKLPAIIFPSKIAQVHSLKIAKTINLKSQFKPKITHNRLALKRNRNNMLGPNLYTCPLSYLAKKYYRPLSPLYHFNSKWPFRGNYTVTFFIVWRLSCRCYKRTSMLSLPKTLLLE